MIEDAVKINRVHDTTYSYKKVHLVVEVVVGVRGPDEGSQTLGSQTLGTTDDALRKALEEGLNDWSDGRQWFNVEVFKEGFSRTFESCLRKAVYDDAYQRYPNKRLLDGTSFAVKLADHKLAKLDDVRVISKVEVVGIKTEVSS